MNRIKKLAYAKINLGLDVLGKREDGYHELRMIMQTIGIADEIIIEKTNETGKIELKINKSDLPADESNLVWKAAKLMTDTYSLSGGLKIDLKKNIPMAAGLAGGSTDAAAIFNGLNELFELGVSKEELCRLGVKIGADVPYCIIGGTALAEGIGEKLTSLPELPDACLLVMKPDFGVSTKYVYETLDSKEITDHPDIDGQIAAIKEHDLKKTVALMGNVLETVTIERYPEIQQIKEDMLSLHSFGSMMSGSGSTVFGFFPEEKLAREARAVMEKKYPNAEFFVTGPAPRN